MLEKWPFFQLSAVVFVSIICLLRSVGYSQGTKIEFASGAQVFPKEEIQPAPGDRFDIDPATGDIVIQYQDAKGNILHKVIDRGMKTKPDISVEYRLASRGVVKYSYTIRHKETSKQDIEMFAISMGMPLISNTVTPAGLMLYYDPDERWQSWFVSRTPLTRGDSATVEFDSPMLPGLIESFITGYPESSGSYLDDVSSEWLRTKVAVATGLRNRAIITSIIGPKIKVGVDSDRAELISKVKDEVHQISTLPEFNEFANNLAAAIRALQSSRVSDARKLLTNLGQTPLQKNYFKAICFDLAYIESLP